MARTNYFVYILLLQLGSNIVWGQRNFPDPSIIDPGSCTCDLRADYCDPNCCCDPNCTSSDLQVVSTCISSSSSASSEAGINIWNCSNSTSEATYDYFPFVCIQMTNNEVRGTYFQTNNLTFVNSSNDASTLRTSFITQFPELFESTTSASTTSTRYTTVGTPVRVNTNQILTVPGRIAGIQCQNNVPVLFRVNRDVSCTLSPSNDPCATIFNQISVLSDGQTSTSAIQFTFYQKIINASVPSTRDSTSVYYFQDSYSLSISNVPTTNGTIYDYCSGWHPVDRTQRYTFCSGLTDTSTCNNYQTFNGCPLRDNLTYSTIDNSFFTARQPSTDDSYDFSDFAGATNVPAITCTNNVALRIFYRFNVSISTNTISTAEVYVILQSSSTVGSLFNQRITIEWNNVSNSNTTDASFPRGYLTDEVLQFRRYSAAGNVSSDVSMLVPNSNGLCIDATRQALSYKQSGSSYCSIQLTQAIVNQCHDLKLNMYLYLNVFYAPASCVIPFPSANSTLCIPIRSTAQDLIDLDRIDETRLDNRLNTSYITANLPSGAPFYTIYDSATSLSTCFGVPSGLYIQFGFARLPLSGTSFVEYIVSVQYNYTYSDWQFHCPTGSCTSASTQRYLVSFQVDFVDVTNQYWNQSDTTRADLTSADNYIEHLLWLITPEYSGEPDYRKYTIAMILIFIAITVLVMHVLFFGFMCPF